ncbi:helix-turn-helix domain-containing protein [Rhizobium lentis]|uniref:helix-turn-helix domain-containing protein n=1 Tax=Rhizobium lentis TaxID=1138194 RepID=UPI001A9227D6|nr:helix-turn-helix transcriptional regulator [Rhizobium lentis]MBX5063303.1 helix-turn-helix transcriptional regulator [Rhizobium lentis]MBX5075408.1 helix-turn-helix transcriptional regulator [Rhizobium lentis]QSW93063.1 helix-turn-helix transcriptional regulator [Rhizobium lentis]
MTLTVADYRKMAGVTQAEMASHMQVPFRTYQDIEAGKVTFRPLHETAAAMALIRIAAARQDTSFLPAGIKNTLRLAASALPPE